MKTEVKPFFIKVITPLHAGSGSDLGVVDMPIQRESHTGFPKIEASSLKGSIRSECRDNEEIILNIEDVFGSEDGSKAGKLGFSDARILFFPVKSVKGVFAYVTCPMVLKRWKEDLKLGSSSDLEEIKIPLSIGDDKCVVFEKSENIIDDKFVVLEEYSFEVQNEEMNNSFKIPSQIDKTRLVIVSDDNFTHFVKNSTEVITRIKIGEDGVVDKKAGALFTEEYLPSETVMYALAIGEIESIKDMSILQIGGNSTLGKGVVEFKGLGNGN